MIQQFSMILQQRTHKYTSNLHRHVAFCDSLFDGCYILIRRKYFAQEADDAVQSTTLLQAEKLIGNATPNGFVRGTYRNVVLTRGAVMITCNRAVHHIEQNRADMFGMSL